MTKAVADRADFRKLLEQALGVLALVGAPLTIGTAVLAAPITAALFGKEYLAATSALVFMACAFVPYFYSTVLGNAVFAANKEKQLFTYVLIGLTGNILLNVLLIPVLGITGAAVGTMINQTVITGYLAWRVRAITPFSLFRGLVRPGIAAGIMGSVVGVFDLFSPSVFVTIPFGAAVYAYCLWILREPIALAVLERLRQRRAARP